MGNINCKSRTKLETEIKSPYKHERFKPVLAPVQEAVKKVSFKTMVDVLEISRHSSQKDERWYSNDLIEHFKYGAKMESRRKYHKETGPIFDNPKKRSKRNESR